MPPRLPLGRRGSQSSPSTATATLPSATPPAPVPARELRPSEKIPPLANLAPVIFVPLTDDFLQKHSESLRDRIEMLKRILESIDFQREGVRENILFMFEREKRRSLLSASEQLAERGIVTPKRALTPDEISETIRNMEAPAEPGLDYDIKDMPRMDLNRPLPADLSIHDRAVENLLSTIEGAITQLDGYDAHISGVKKQYLDRLERELSRINDAGLRPEERTQARKA